MCVCVYMYVCEHVCIYACMYVFMFFFPLQLYFQVTTRRASSIYSNGCYLKIKNDLFKLICTSLLDGNTDLIPSEGIDDRALSSAKKFQKEKYRGRTTRDTFPEGYNRK